MGPSTRGERVLAWEPPHRLSFTWHLFFQPADATEVELVFRAAGDTTVVQLTQTGFDRLGSAGETRRENTRTAWSMLVREFAASV